ncbi:MAG TPA: hypothetical protein VEH31_38745, partial [Streptosporangiaceae bacterium]|nr:hypothetical protein [Streptosporangiaceae bacterium]
VHAARDAELSRRYAAVHARTVEALTGVLATIWAQDAQAPAIAPRRLAELMLAFSTGATLEQAANAEALGGRQLDATLAQVLEPLVRPAAASAPATVPAPAAAPASAAGRARA